CLILVITVYQVDVFASKDQDDYDNRRIAVEYAGYYDTWGGDLDNLKSPADISNGIVDELKGSPKGWKIKYVKSDYSVWETDFKGVSIGGHDNEYADSVDMLIYTGHGVKPKHHGATDYSFALNTYKNTRYAKQSEMYLGNGDLEWLVTFTCNFLASKDLDKIGHMSKGLHAICGYESSVILTPHMGRIFLEKLKRGISVKEAFFATSLECRVGIDKIINKKGENVAGVFTTKKNENDRLWGFGDTASDPLSYSKDNNKIKSKYKLCTYDY
nr:DUF6345 domain-containing protein [Clostridia bacterium]